MASIKNNIIILFKIFGRINFPKLREISLEIKGTIVLTRKLKLVNRGLVKTSFNISKVVNTTYQLNTSLRIMKKCNVENNFFCVHKISRMKLIRSFANINVRELG